MSECIFCLHYETRHTDEEYNPCTQDYEWTSYEYCTYHDKKISNREDEEIYRGTGCEKYTEY